MQRQQLVSLQVVSTFRLLDSGELNNQTPYSERYGHSPAPQAIQAPLMPRFHSLSHTPSPSIPFVSLSFWSTRALDRPTNLSQPPMSLSWLPPPLILREKVTRNNGVGEVFLRTFHPSSTFVAALTPFSSICCLIFFCPRRYLIVGKNGLSPRPWPLSLIVRAGQVAG
jgi:hypothetical protein